MTLTQWTDRLCEALGIDPELEVDAILDLARDAAHQIDRPAAPLTTFWWATRPGPAAASPATSRTASTSRPS